MLLVTLQLTQPLTLLLLCHPLYTVGFFAKTAKRKIKLRGQFNPLFWQKFQVTKRLFKSPFSASNIYPTEFFVLGLL